MIIPHLHLLLSGAKHEKPNTWDRKWFSIGGIAKIEFYDSSMGAKYYLGDKMAREYNEIIFCKDLTPLMSQKLDIWRWEGHSACFYAYPIGSWSTMLLDKKGLYLIFENIAPRQNRHVFLYTVGLERPQSSWSG